MKLTCSLLYLLLLSSSFGVIKQATVTGRLFVDFGPAASFFDTEFPVPFTASWQFDTDAMDENPDPSIGEYESEGLPMTLDFGGYHFESFDTTVTVWSGFNGPNWGFTLWNDSAFSQNGFDIPEYGIYMQFNLNQPIVAPNDGIDSVAEYDLSNEGSIERMYVINEDYYEGPQGPDAVRLLSDVTSGIDTLTVTDVVPEPTTFGLLLISSMLAFRRSRAQEAAIIREPAV